MNQEALRKALEVVSARNEHVPMLERFLVTYLAADEEFPAIIVNGELVIDHRERKAFQAGKELSLTKKEYDLLALFVRNAGRMLTKREILLMIWGQAFVESSQYLRIYVAQLREKLGEIPDNPKLIICKPGVGYFMPKFQGGVA